MFCLSMKRVTLGKESILCGNINGVSSLKDRITEIFDYYKTILPGRTDATILLKPNLNNDLGGLTGATTDLRVLITIIEELKNRGYNNLIIGDGSNCGVFHNKINTFKRLRIGRIAEIYSIKNIDFNNTQRKRIELFSRPAYVANITIDCDFFINIPKIKTHTEAVLSLCCKNLVGCFLGYEKRNVHSKYHENIHLLPKIFNPQLHIVDGLVAMEGNGPGAGTPIRLNTIFASTNPYLLDAYVAQLLGIPFRNIGYLKIAYDERDIGPGEMKQLNAVNKEFNILMPEIVAWKNFLLSNWFVKPRYWKIFSWMFDNRFVDWLLLTLKIRQDIFIDSDAVLQKVCIDHSKCSEGCNRCETFCPMNNPISDSSFQPNVNNCLQCLYCYFICKHGALNVLGEHGYLRNHEERYKKLIEEL